MLIHTNRLANNPTSANDTVQTTVHDPLPPQYSGLRRLSKTPQMMHYNRLIVLVCLINIGIFSYGLASRNGWRNHGIDLQQLANLVVANITLTVIIRQQYVVNFLFWLATRAPVSWPLPLRAELGKVYHFGGLHVGGAISGTVWFALFVGSLTYKLFTGVETISWGLAVVAYLILALLVMIIIFSLPKNRAKHHDRFERSHRFGGWAVLLLFWVQTILFVNQQRGDLSFSAALFSSFGFWMLIIVTFSIALPWLRLRRVPVQIETPSSHVALTRFDYGETPFAGSSTAISRNPLLEWHSFANVPTPGETGFRLTISRAGDWTGKFIDDKPQHVWVKGITTAGVAKIEVLFKRVIYVATGSGIGPCLPHLLANDVPSLLVWSTKSPRKTYGDAFVDEILRVQPNAIIWDTDTKGRPDLLKLSYEAYKQFDAEAVICISNQKLTWDVVFGLESRGIPAYGAIWDS